jgi:hypothetical protein
VVVVVVVVAAVAAEEEEARPPRRRGLLLLLAAEEEEGEGEDHVLLFMASAEAVGTQGLRVVRRVLVLSPTTSTLSASELGGAVQMSWQRGIRVRFQAEDMNALLLLERKGLPRDDDFEDERNVSQ